MVVSNNFQYANRDRPTADVSKSIYVHNFVLTKKFIPFSDRFQNDDVRNANDSKLVRFINVTTTFP